VSIVIEKRIAILGLKRIGDAIYTLPLIEALKQQGKVGLITVFTEPQVAAIYEANPFIDDVQVFRKADFWWQTLAQLKAEQFDVCIVLHNAFKYALLPFLARIPVRIGYVKEGRGWLLTHKLPLPTTVIHRLEHNARLGDVLGVDARGLLPQIYVGDEETEKYQALLKDLGLVAGGYVVMVVGSISPTRRWFHDRFAEVVKRIAVELKLTVIVVGGPDDAEAGESVMHLSGGLAWNLAGRTSLRETIWLMRSAKAMITNDTGPMHVASAIGIPTITWYGAANEDEIAPPSPNTTILNARVPCSPCVKETCANGLICLKGITPEMVMSALKAKL
jgi:heptosyltransferase-2